MPPKTSTGSRRRPTPAARASEPDPEAQIRGFIAKFDAPHQKLIHEVRRVLRQRLPGANELVYDNYNFLVIGYGATERPSDCILSVAAGASGVGLSFPFCGTRLPDPHKLLQGEGSRNRFIRVPSAKVLGRPEVDALIAAAVAVSAPLPTSGKGKLIIRSISAKQRPRRHTSK